MVVARAALCVAVLATVPGAAISLSLQAPRTPRAALASQGDPAGARKALHSFQEVSVAQLVNAHAGLRTSPPPAVSVPEFRFMQPPHTGTVTVLAGLTLAAGCHASGPCEPLGVGDSTRLHSHATLGRFSPGPWQDWKGAVTFAFARDPWSRMISCAGWNMAIDSAIGTQNRTADENIHAFREFVRANLHGGQRGNCAYLGSITDFTHAVPPNETEPRQVVNFVGRTASLAEDFDHVLGLLGLPHFDLAQLPVHCMSGCPHGNGRGPHGQEWAAVAALDRLRVTDYFDDETRALVAAAWQGDIEAFGFRFGEH